jgi:hypothetical protein
MDTRLEQALEFANYKATIFQQKQNLKLKLENTLTISLNGGTFRVTQELISFIDTLMRRDINEAVLIDTRENPVKVSDLSDFQSKIISRYFEATNEYHVEMEKLRRARSVSQATDMK